MSCNWPFCNWVAVLSLTLCLWLSNINSLNILLFDSLSLTLCLFLSSDSLFLPLSDSQFLSLSLTLCFFPYLWLSVSFPIFHSLCLSLLWLSVLSLSFTLCLWSLVLVLYTSLTIHSFFIINISFSALYSKERRGCECCSRKLQNIFKYCQHRNLASFSHLNVKLGHVTTQVLIALTNK